MQGHVVEHGLHSAALELLDEGVPAVGTGHEQVVQMSVVVAVVGYDGTPRLALGLERRECLVVAAPNGPSLLGDPFARLELGPQEGRADLAGGIRRSDVLPAILVDLAAKEGGSRRALLLDDLGAGQVA